MDEQINEQPPVEKQPPVEQSQVEKKKFPIVPVVIGIVVLILVIGGWYAYKMYNNDNNIPQTSDELTECERVGGKWKKLPDSCVDGCDYQNPNTPHPGCYEALTDGCDCGPDRCWDEVDGKNTCIPNPWDIDEIDTSNWQTYRNEKYGFELNYPITWPKPVISEPSPSIEGVLYLIGVNFHKDTNGIEAIDVGVYEKNASGFDYELIDEGVGLALKPGVGPSLANCSNPVTNITFGAENYPAKEILVTPHDDCFLEVHFFYIRRGDYDYLITPRDSDLSEFDQLFDTFKFIGEPAITVLSPKDGDEWEVGSEQTIKWSTSNLPEEEAIGEEAAIGIQLGNSDLDEDGFSAGIENDLPNTGEYVWKIPETIESGSYKILIYTQGIGERISATNDGIFTIVD